VEGLREVSKLKSDDLEKRENHVVRKFHFTTIVLVFSLLIVIVVIILSRIIGIFRLIT